MSDSNAMVPPPPDSTIWRSVTDPNRSFADSSPAFTARDPLGLQPKFVQSVNTRSGLPSFSKLADSSLMLTKPSTQSAQGFPELKLLPAYICRHTAFVARLPASQLVAKMWEVLQSTQLGLAVDLEPPSGKPKLKGVGRLNGSKTVFGISLFRNPSSDVVVECKKEDGCTVLFNRLYQQLLTCLGDVVMRRLNDSGSQKTNFPLALPLPSLPSPPSSSLSTLYSLLEMARSQFLDQQLQACETLLEVSRGDSAGQLLELAVSSPKVDVVAVLCSLLRSESDDIVRIAALVLSNLLKFDSPPFTEKALQTIAPMFEILAVPMTYLNRDTKRHVSAALNVLAKARREAFSAAQRQILEGSQHVWDPIRVQTTLHVA